MARDRSIVGLARRARRRPEKCIFDDEKARGHRRTRTDNEFFDDNLGLAC